MYDKLNTALERVSDAHLQEAEDYKKKIHGWVRYVAAAAVLALVMGALAFWPVGEENYVTGPGLLSIRAYALDEKEISEVNSTVLEEGVELPWEYVWSPAINIVRGLPIKLDFPTDGYEDAKITLEISTSGGSFYGEPVRCQDPITKEYYWSDNLYLGSNFTISNNCTLYWGIFSATYNSAEQKYTPGGDLARGSSYLDIIIRADDMIIGYAVVEIYELPQDEAPKFSYKARVIDMVSFPKVDGAYQPITRRYINKLLKEIHQTV